VRCIIIGHLTYGFYTSYIMAHDSWVFGCNVLYTMHKLYAFAYSIYVHWMHCTWVLNHKENIN